MKASSESDSRLLAHKRDYYATAWREYSRWHKTSIALVILAIPYFATIGMWIQKWLGSGGFVVAGLLWMAAVGFTTIGASSLICPRCGSDFFRPAVGRRGLMFLTNNCIWCGLRKYAEPTEDARA